MKNSAPNESPDRTFLSRLQVFHDLEPHSAAMNMALDEVLLQTATRPLLRFYGWRRPSLSFGYFTRFAEVSAEAAQRELVRRWTGGGIVSHGDDLTYSFILPRGTATLPSPRAVYEMLHGAIRETLAEQADISLAREDAPKISEACFANAVMADVLVQGRKIAGAAQRRTRAGLLHQGSIQYEKLPEIFPDAFAATLCPDFSTMTPGADCLGRARILAEKKYETTEWLRQR